MPTAPAFVDEHRITVPAPRDRVWSSLRGYVDRSLLRERDGVLTQLLGTEPRSGFALSMEVPGTELRLSGRHRFSRYELVFQVGDGADGATEVRALTYADFPGVRGRVYRALVIGSRAHVLAVRAMLRAVERASVTRG